MIAKYKVYIGKLLTQFKKYKRCSCDHSWEVDSHSGKDCESNLNEKLIKEGEELLK